MKKINSWSEYEKFKISQDIVKYFGEFIIDLKSKIGSEVSFGDLFGLGGVLFFLLCFKKSLCSNLLQKKSNN